MTCQRVLVIGGSGFIGSHLVARLASLGKNIRVPTRRYMQARHLLPLPTVDIVETDIHDDAALARLIEGQDAVINLVGALHSESGAPYGKTFRRLHVELPERIARICAEQGVTRLIHMSALGADSAGASMYQRSRGDGEAVIRRIFENWPQGELTIFRPSVVFGPEDRFLNLFAALARWLPILTLAGGNARLQPIYVGDVALAIAKALDDRLTYGKTYELAGPQVYTLKELVGLAATWSGHPRPILPMPMALGKLQACVLGLLPGKPLISSDNLDSLKRDNVLSAPMAPELDMHPTTLETIAPDYLAGAHPRTRFDALRTRPGRR